MRRAISILALVAAAGIVGLGLILAGRGSDVGRSVAPLAGTAITSESAATSEPEGASMVETALIGMGARDPARSSKKASIVVYGTVTKVDPGRWNSRDGKRWTPPTESDLPVIYRTFYVEPIEILKGAPKWGTPVAFMVTGGTEGVVAGPVAVGDRVLVIGRDLLAEGGLFGNVFWKEDAYFAQHMEFSVFVEKAGRLEVVAAEKQPEYATANLAAIRSALAASPAGPSD